MASEKDIKKLFETAKLFLPVFLELKKDELEGRAGVYLSICEIRHPDSDLMK
jgi:hypothetical protein